MTWPPDNASDAPAPPAFPPASWPSRSQLDYVRALVVALLLLLALPWLVANLIVRPGAVLTGLGQRVVAKGPVG